MVQRVASCLVLALFLWLVLCLATPAMSESLNSGSASTLPRRHQAAGDLKAVSKLRCAARRLNCETYRAVSAGCCRC